MFAAEYSNTSGAIRFQTRGCRRTTTTAIRIQAAAAAAAAAGINVASYAPSVTLLDARPHLVDRSSINVIGR
jgi:hypothetical protein